MNIEPLETIFVAEKIDERESQGEHGVQIANKYARYTVPEVLFW